MTKEEALELEALKYAASMGHGGILREMKITPFTIKEALAQPEQVPVAGDVHTEHCFQGEYKHCCKYGDGDDCTAAPKRPWVGLTDDEMQALWDRYAHMEMMRAIEAKLKEKNT